MGHVLYALSNTDQRQAPRGSFFQSAITAADDRIDFTQFDTILFVSREVDHVRFAWPVASQGRWGPFTTQEGDVTLGVISMPFSWQEEQHRSVSRTAAHELGHNLGLADLSKAPNARRIGGWDLMDSEGDLPHLSLAHRMILGWVPASAIRTFNFASSGGPIDETVRLRPAELAPASPLFTGAEVRIADGFNYYFEYRKGQDTHIGDRRLPADNVVLGTDVVSYAMLDEIPVVRPPIELLREDGDNDGSAFRTGASYRETDISDPTYPANLQVEVQTASDSSSADARVRYDVTGRPDPSIRPAPASEDRRWQSPDIEVRNLRNQMNAEWFNAPWVGNPNTVVARITNRGAVDAPRVRVDFYALDYNVGGAPRFFLGSDTRDIPAHTTVEFSTAWTPPREGHFCIHAVIPPYQVPGAAVAELTDRNNDAGSNYDRFISASASPATREETRIAVKNPYAEPALVTIVPGQTNPLYRTYLEHTWLRLAPGESVSVRVSSEYAGDDLVARAALGPRTGAVFEEFRRRPNRASFRTWIRAERRAVDSEAKQDVAFQSLGGADMEVVERVRTAFDGLSLRELGAQEGAEVEGRVYVVRTGAPAPDGDIILTLSRTDDGRRKAWNLVTPLRGGVFKVQAPEGAGWEAVEAYYLAPPGEVADAESGTLQRTSGRPSGQE